MEECRKKKKKNPEMMLGVKGGRKGERDTHREKTVKQYNFYKKRKKEQSNFTLSPHSKKDNQPEPKHQQAGQRFQSRVHFKTVVAS